MCKSKVFICQECGYTGADFADLEAGYLCPSCEKLQEVLEVCPCASCTCQDNL